jgi:hypothetical protein
MTDENRRGFLKQLGAATTLTAVAGCLGNDENQESTPNNTSEPTDNQQTDTPEDTQNQETEESTPEESENDAFSTLDYLPATSELSGLNDSGDTPAVTAINHGYPADMAETFSSETVSTYEENGWVVPNWAGFGLADVDEKATFVGGATQASPVAVYKMTEGSSIQLEGADQVGEIGGMGLYEVTVEDGEPKTVLAGDEYVIESAFGPRSEQLRTLLTRMTETEEGERSSYMEEEQFGDVWPEVDYDELMAATMAGRNVDLDSDEFAAAVNHDISSETYTAEIGTIYNDGAFQVESEQTRENTQGAFYGRGWI